MNDKTNFEAWKRTRVGGEVPEGFADRMMAKIGEREVRRGSTGLLLFLASVTSCRPGLAVATALAAAVFLYRAACSFGVFFTG